MSRDAIRILQATDRPALEAFLLPRLHSSMFLLSNLRAAGLEDTGERYAGTYAAVFEDDRIVGVVAHYWNGNFILQAQGQLAELLDAALAWSKRQIKGVLGPAEEVHTALAALPVDESNVQLDETEKLYHLKLDALVEPKELRSGRVHGRRIETRDLDLAAEWRTAYSIETLGDQDTAELRERCRAAMERSRSEGTTWILEDGGTPVAMTSFNAEVAEAVQVGGVWSPPSLRGRRYARAVVAASLIDARAEGKELAILFTGVGNIPAQKAYEALGFQHSGDYRVVLLREAITSR